ncbi:MAG TPA: LPS export ABC transporter permease LptF, partial [Rhodobacteraceae bacterium]|nr:LPS export ABC transporter permease LptF [Paracoccaceae bacterium]
MTRIDRYILSQLIGAFGLFAMILVSIYWLNRAVSIFGRLIADGQGAGIFLQIIALSLPYVVSLVLPVAVLAAALWVTNSLTAESERVVMEAAGAGGWRLTRAYLVFGTLVAVLLALLVHWLVPASRAALSAKSDEIARDVVARLVVPGEFLHPAPGVTLFIGSASPSGDIENLFLHESTAEGTRSYTADRAMLVSDALSPVLLMFDGLVQTLDRTNGSLAVVGFRDLAYELAPLVSDRSGRVVPLREVNSWRLLRAGAALRGATD